MHDRKKKLNEFYKYFIKYSGRYTWFGNTNALIKYHLNRLTKNLRMKWHKILLVIHELQPRYNTKKD